MSTARDWWDPRYLLTQVQGPWLKTLQAVMQQGGDQRASLDLSIKIRDLAANIVRSKRYRLVSDYFAYYLSRTPAMYEANTFAKVTPHFYQAIISLYQAVCTSKHKMLVGTAGTMPLWVDPPTGWLGGEGEGKFDLNNLRVPARVVVPMILKIMPLLSGDGRQQQFDRLMLPPPDKWPTFDEWTRASIERLDEITATRLGFDGRVEEDEYLQIMSYAYLERRYNLVPGYPVLVRLQEHPIFHQLILMQRGSWIIARLERHRHNDILLMLSTEELATDSTVDFVKPMLLGTDSFSNYALPALVATVYRDLVTVEEKAINKQRSNLARLRLPKKKKDEEDNKPKFYTTSWQYIPRRLYLYNSKDESVASRRGLEETEQERQRAIRRWHSVCGHVRRYQDKPDGWIAKADKVDQALADGIILRTGETYVKPHARGLAALDELGEIDLATIPHYLRRKFE